MLDLTKYGIAGLQSLARPLEHADTTPDPAPVFTAQPAPVALFQVGSALSSTGAALDQTTSTVWQKQQADGTWASTQLTGTDLVKNSAVSNDAGVYRLMAVNGNSSPVYSNLVYAYDCFLYIQTDTDNNNPATTGVRPGADRYNWIEDGPAGTRLYSAFLRFNKDQTLPSGTVVAENTPISPAGITELGFTIGRMVASWTSNNSAVVTITKGYSPGQTGVRLNTGTATVTAKFQNLTSKVDVTIP